MVPTDGEGEGSRSRARRRRRSTGRPTPLTLITRSRAGGQSEPAPPSERATSRATTGSRAPQSEAVSSPEQGTRQAPTGSRAPQSEAVPPSERGKSKRRSASKERHDKRKRARADKKSREEEDKAAKKSLEDEDKAAKKSRADEDKAATASTGNEEPASSASADSSSVVSSPCRCPSLPLVVKGYSADGTEIYDTIDPEIFDIYIEEDAKYCAKLERERSLLTLENIPPSCLSSQELLSVRESATETVLHAAKKVLGLSSYIDGKLLARSSGFFIDWDEKSKIGKILTSAHLMCLKYPSLHDKSGVREYASDAEVKVHLSHVTSMDGRLLYYHKYYNIAVVEISADQSPELLYLSDEVKYAQEVFLLGRGERLILNISHGRVQFMGPGLFEHNHYMFVNCGLTRCDAGGPVIDFDGRVLGMADPTSRAAFIPVSVILRLLHMQTEFNCVPRLHLGLKYSVIKFLDPSHIDMISGRFSIDAGLIVTEVSEGSVAEKVGIRAGDIIKCLNGEKICTTIELENMLLHLCEDHLSKGNGFGSIVDITVGVFHIRKERHRTRKLVINMCDDVEVVAGGTYPVSAREGHPTLCRLLI